MVMVMTIIDRHETRVERSTTPAVAAPQGRVRTPSNRVGDLAALAAGAGAGITAAFTVPALIATDWSAPGAVANGLGIVTAMAGTYGALLSILLMARLPFLEHEVGQDRLTAWHRSLGPWTLVLIVMHVVLTTLGYAQMVNAGWWSELVSLTFGSAWMLPAMAATLLMIGLGLMSWRRIRSRMRYETWHIAHLYFYLAVALAFGHQIEAGSVFMNAPLARVWWIGLYVALAAAILVFRFGAPIRQSLRHGLRVSRVEAVDADTVHVHMTGRHLDGLHAEGGQWFSFRFGTRRWWWQGHPYSLSAGPTSSSLRITVKNLGDQSGSLMTLEPGTPVFVEGPYGAFRVDRRRTDHVVLVGAGVGITPLRAMLDELPSDVRADVIYRVHAEPAPLVDELRRLEQRSGGRIRVHLLVGSRREWPMTPGVLAAQVPGLAQADVYICGPTSFTQTVAESAEALGITPDRIHHETFEF
jgi:predicted ferric reductase